ncbi:hypothetical protein FHX81_7387 [Saccharothrix saharensis]|uniref:Uncharacterized protein n=1 Tax=Saccharothrix saharensis TaxID=571190 RepID=A0A543JQ05_9PSEU|nr:hypothetical protein [Saccharothrix saharensis]TQM84922.1 hypothetical protein FHX81_7387 [Saccharothrix saharensis]
MTVLADFEVIVKGFVDIGDGAHEFSVDFDTSGVYSGKPAVIALRVRGLTALSEYDPEILINDQYIGRITATHWSDPKLQAEAANHWYSQHTAFAGHLLNNGKNTFRVRALKLKDPKPGNEYDNFAISSVVCFYHQEK